MLTSLLTMAQAAQLVMVSADDPMSYTVINSPTNSTYSTGLINLETITVGLSGSNIYYSTTYSLDGKENVTVPFTKHQDTIIQATMKGSVALPLLSEGSHSITVYEKVEANTTPPKAYVHNYTVNFAVVPQIHSSPSIAPVTPSTTPPSTTPQADNFFSQLSPLAIPCAIAIVVVALFLFVYFKRRKSRTSLVKKL
jgi:hypothetical protein